MKTIKYINLFVLALVLMVLAPLTHAETPATTAPASIPAPTGASGVVKNFYTQLADTMRDGDKLGFAGRYKKLEPAVTSAFNLSLMTRYAVGLVWSKATPDEQQQLVSAFSDFTIANYASQFKKDDGEQFEVIDEKPASGGVIVETRLKPKEGEAVALNYLMKPDEKGQYRIVDVFLDGTISQLATRRSEFSAIVNKDGVSALVNSLGDKTKQMGPS